MNIVLIGARGSGKSSVARELGTLLNRELISTDAEIERRAGRSIATLVEESGWEVFRDLESAVVRDIAPVGNRIIDTGGGVIVRPENVDVLRAHGRIFWLQAPVEALAARIKDSVDRPPLTDATSFVEEIAHVLAMRTPLYSAAAHHTVKTDGRSAEEIAREVATMSRAEGL